MSRSRGKTVAEMAQRRRKLIFTAMRRVDCNSRDGVAGGLRGERLMNMFVSEVFPPLNVGAMLIAWCYDIWKPPSGGQIAWVFYAKISRIFEVVTPNL